MVTVANLLTMIKLYKLGSSAYKQYKRSNKGKSKRKRNKMVNIGWSQK